jgi:hypothetical protein
VADVFERAVERSDRGGQTRQRLTRLRLDDCSLLRAGNFEWFASLDEPGP